jgi:hypothetical protein
MRPVSQAKKRKLDQAKRKDIAVRAAKTWTQAFLAVITTGLLDITDTNALKALVVAGVASGISAVWNAFYNPITSSTK